MPGNPREPKAQVDRCDRHALRPVHPARNPWAFVPTMAQSSGVYAICTAKAPSISSFGAAPSISASALFTPSSDMPPPGRRAAAWSRKSNASTNDHAHNADDQGRLCCHRARRRADEVQDPTRGEGLVLGAPSGIAREGVSRRPKEKPPESTCVQKLGAITQYKFYGRQPILKLGGSRIGKSPAAEVDPSRRATFRRASPRHLLIYRKKPSKLSHIL
jgi:hypothetical protein